TSSHHSSISAMNAAALTVCLLNAMMHHLASTSYLSPTTSHVQEAMDVSGAEAAARARSSIIRELKLKRAEPITARQSQQLQPDAQCYKKMKNSNVKRQLLQCNVLRVDVV